MKKIFLSILLMALMATATAQFAVSVHLGGSYATGGQSFSSNYEGYSHITHADTSYAIEIDPTTNDVPLDLTGGVKLGYQYGRMQFGLSGSFSWSRLSGDFSPEDYKFHNPNLPIDKYINPAWELVDYQGNFVAQQTSFTIAPYFRYEVIQLGDVAFFLELEAFYSRANKPKRHEFIDFYHLEMHHTVDKDSVVNDVNTAMGARITPGMSWQLSEHCYIDLYFDLLSLAYVQNTRKTVTVTDTWDYTTSPAIISLRTINTTTTTTKELGFQTQGVPTITGNSNNWVRVGFNYTF